MNLAAGFQFSQAGLQDYVDCPRRFQLGYVLRLRWPAVETDPVLENERRLRQGAALHRLIRQREIGVPEECLSRSIWDLEVERWWNNYLDARPAASSHARHPEVTLSTVMGENYLAARYDLIGVGGDGRVLVFDWKTYRARPRRSWLADRLQTRVYPYVLIRAWDALGYAGALEPERVSMVYWFAEFPSSTESFDYDAKQFRADGQYLQGLVEEAIARIAACAEGDFLERTAHTERCQFCRYRSLCRRGVEPGQVIQGTEELATDDLSDLDLDFDQIAEFEIG